MELDARGIDRIVRAVADRLEGDWLLVGGAFVAVCVEDRRTTEDVDLVAIPASQAKRLALFELAEELGLPVEALNTAADFFIERIADWRDETEVLYRGRRGTVLRPSGTLFLLLKIGRLSDRDLADCLALLAREPVDANRVVRALDALAAPEDDALADRRRRLRERLA